MKKFSDDKYTKIAILTVITVAASYLAILILGQSGSLLMGLLSLLAWIFDVVTPLILGLVFAYILLPVVNVFDKLLGRLPLIKDKPGLCRGISIFTTLFSLFLVIFILLSLVISTITSNIHFISFEDLRLMAEYIGVQASNLYNEIRDNLLRYDIAIPDTDTLLKSARHQITSIDGKKGSNIAQVFGTGLLGAFNFVKNIVVQFFFAIIFSIYFLYDNKGMGKYWSRAFRAILGEKGYGVFGICLSDLDRCFAGYIRGQLADAVFMAVVMTVALSIAGIPYAALIGIATGIGNLIPYVGPVVAYGMTIICCLLKGEFKLIVIGVIIVFIIQTIDGNIVNPRLLSSSIDVHPVLVIVALLFGGAIGGLLGMLLAVPVAAFLRIQFERFVKFRE
ncbi:MAG: AI-2E family transporter [Lachnospiraceae bacterium]|nr:AI-2E family transporter [Lachnospiraceae bacterium]